MSENRKSPKQGLFQRGIYDANASLERNIVVKVHRRLIGSRCRSLLLRTRLRAAAELVSALRLLRLSPTALLLTTACRGARALLTTAEHLHRAANVDYNLGGVFFLTRLGSPFTGAQLAFNIDL